MVDISSSSDLQPIIFSISGSLGIKLLDLAEISKIERERRPDFKDIFFWIAFVVPPILAAGLAYAYVASGVELSPILAMNVGASAPLLFRSLANAVPTNIPPPNPPLNNESNQQDEKQ